jgi:hypothetical protein
MDSKVVYVAIGILVVYVVVLTGLVGYFYGVSNISTSTTTYISTTATTQLRYYTFTVTSTSTFTTTIATSFEKLEITNAYASDSQHVVLNLKNTGSSDATITDIFVNGKQLAAVNGGSSAPATPISLTTGLTTTITLTFIPLCHLAPLTILKSIQRLALTISKQLQYHKLVLHQILQKLMMEPKLIARGAYETAELKLAESFEEAMNRLKAK